MMGTTERQLFRARFAWLCKWLLSDVYGGGCFTVKVVCLSAEIGKIRNSNSNNSQEVDPSNPLLKPIQPSLRSVSVVRKLALLVVPNNTFASLNFGRRLGDICDWVHMTPQQHSINSSQRHVDESKT